MKQYFIFTNDYIKVGNKSAILPRLVATLFAYGKCWANTVSDTLTGPIS